MISLSSIVKIGSGYELLQTVLPHKSAESAENPKSTGTPEAMAGEIRNAYLDEIRREQEQIIGTAVKRSQLIETEAEHKAQSLIERARKMSGEIMAEAEKKGYDAGYKDGLEIGAEDARRTAFVTIDEIKRFADLMNERLNETVQNQSKDLIKLSFTIAEKIMRQQIAVSEDAVGTMMDDLLRDQRGSLKVYVSEYDSILQLQMGKAVAEKLKRDWQDTQVVLLQENDRLMVETEEGTLDAGINEQLPMLKEVVDAEI